MRDKFKLLKNKKILITGNTGFIGSWLSLALHELGADILGISKELKKNYISSTKEYQKNIKTIKIDIKNIHLKRKAILKFKPEYIIHLASQPIVTDSYRDPIYTFDNNIISTTKFLEFIKNIKSIKKIIIFTSDKVYKNSKKELSENDSLGGSDPYSVSKACQDIISNFYASKIFKNFDTTIVRAGNVIGGGDFAKDRLIVDIVKAIKKKNYLEIRNINAIRPWQHIYDLVKVTIDILMIKNIDQPEVFNISGDKKSQIEVKKIISLFKEKFTLKTKVTKPKLHENKILLLNSKKLKKRFKNLNFMKIETNIEETIEWYKNCYLNKNVLNKYKFSKEKILEYLNRI